MADILLLGHIPGTSIYISFWAWLAAFDVLVALIAVVTLRKQLWFGLIYLSLRMQRRLNRLNRLPRPAEL